MLEKFSASAIQVLNAAREEALRLEFGQVDTDHLLLGLVHERQGLAARSLRKLGIEQRRVRLAVEQRSGRGYSPVRQEDLVFSVGTLRTLALAARSCPTLVESQDVFRAILCERESPVVGVFEELGLRLDELTAMADSLQQGDRAPDTAVAPELAVLPRRFAPRLLTPAAQSVMSYASAAARFYGHTLVGTEQLLMGLVYVRLGLAGQVLEANHVDPVELEAVASRLIGQGSGTLPGRQTLSRWSEEVLELAWAIARKQQHTQVGTGHLLLALMDLDVGGALYLMDHLGLDQAQVRMDLEEALRLGGGEAEPGAFGVSGETACEYAPQDLEGLLAEALEPG